MSTDQRARLLDELRIDRGRDGEPHSGASSRRRVALTLALGALIVAAGWWALEKPQGTPAADAEEAASPPTTELRSAPSTPSSLLDASGYVVARRRATVSAEVTGRVVEMLIEEGQSVANGEVLARLDDSAAHAVEAQARAQLAQAQAELEAARIALENARPIFDRNRRQLESRTISAHDFDTARAAFEAAEADLAVKERAVAVARAGAAVAEENRRKTVVRAPFDGVVTVKAAQVGEIVSPVSAGGGFTRTGIGTIVDMDSLEVEVDVSETFIDRVRPGQPARVTVNAYPDTRLPAKVIAVVPTADRASATVKVRVGFERKDPRVLPEMGARVSFLRAESEDGAGEEDVCAASRGAATAGEDEENEN